MKSTSIHLTLTMKLRARAKEAAKVEGLSVPEYLRRCIVAGCERTEALEARRVRTATADREGGGHAPAR